MKRPKKPKRDNRTKYMMSDKQLYKMKDEIVSEAVHRTGLLYLAALSEKGWQEDEIIDLFETVSRYVNYLDDNLIRIKYVEYIIEKHTGIKFNGGW